LVETWERTPNNVTHREGSIIVGKNRKRGVAALMIVIFFVPISAWLVFWGLQPGRPDVSWALVLFGSLGILTFGASGVLVIRTMRAPWRLEINPAHLTLYAPTYDLKVPWEKIAGIAVDEVNRRLCCALIFEDVASLAQGAEFHGNSKRPDAVTGPGTMQARMDENLHNWGYHLAIPGRILEIGPEELADLLARAKSESMGGTGDALTGPQSGDQREGEQ
jgi:hypothetical protein